MISQQMTSQASFARQYTAFVLFLLSSCTFVASVTYLGTGSLLWAICSVSVTAAVVNIGNLVRTVLSMR